MRLNGFSDVQLHIIARATRALRCAIAHRGMTEEARRRDYFTVSAPALQATASWSPVAPLQPTAPMILPPSTSGIPPGDAVGGGESSVMITAPAGFCIALLKICVGRRRRAEVRALFCEIVTDPCWVLSI